MQLSASASSAIIIWYFVGSLINLVVLVGLFLGLRRLNEKVTALETSVRPTLDKAEKLIGIASEKLDTVGASAEHLLARGEQTAALVHSKTEQTAGNVQKAIYSPLIGINALAAGLMHGAVTFGVRQSEAIRGRTKRP